MLKEIHVYYKITYCDLSALQHTKRKTPDIDIISDAFKPISNSQNKYYYASSQHLEKRKMAHSWKLATIIPIIKLPLEADKVQSAHFCVYVFRVKPS